MTLLQQFVGYWMDGRQLRMSYINVLFANPTMNMPDLPSAWVSDDLPFASTEVDFDGPLYTSQTSNHGIVYVWLFICASTRAVHLELVPNFNAESILLAFRQFVSGCGLPTTLIICYVATMCPWVLQICSRICTKNIPHEDLLAVNHCSPCDKVYSHLKMGQISPTLVTVYSTAHR